METSSEPVQAAKFSRYRSVRRAVPCEEQKIEIPPIPQTPTSAGSQISRQPSRYRRPTIPQSHHVPLPGIKPATVTSTQSTPSQHPQSSPANHAGASPPAPPPQSRPARYGNRADRNGSIDRSQRTQGSISLTESLSSRRESYEVAREEARLILEGEYDRLQQMRTQRQQGRVPGRTEAAQLAPISAQNQDSTQAGHSRTWVIGDGTEKPSRYRNREQQKNGGNNTSATLAHQESLQTSKSPPQQAVAAFEQPTGLSRAISTRQRNSRTAVEMNQQSQVLLRNPQHANAPASSQPDATAERKASAHTKPQFADAPVSLSAQSHARRPSAKIKPQFADAPVSLNRTSLDRRPTTKVKPQFADAPVSLNQQPTRSTEAKAPNATPRFHDAPVSQPKALQNLEPKSAAEHAQKFDAPVSAVNAGERRVQIKFEDATITLPVTPTTTAKDLLNSASVCLSQPIDPRVYVLLESFEQLGLERPLRRYERIRDVMNSWDSDLQNHLLILPPAECEASGLEVKDAPGMSPGTVMLNMHHSQKPGKWEKHWLILKSDGQVTASKKENDGNASNIFHISDFDVYMPTKKQQKKLHPPKKICFAVKSQQKSAMFLDGGNFVHFFATSEKPVADQWYNAIQMWRSWYLVDVLGEGKPVTALPADALNTKAPVERPATARSRDSIPYQLGSFEPLFDFSVDDISADLLAQKSEEIKISSPPRHLVDFASNRQSFDMNKPSDSRRSDKQRAAPPSSFPSRFSVDHGDRTGLVGDLSDQGFTGKGLLARARSTKRSQGGEPTGHGVAGPKGKPLVNLPDDSEFAAGSLLRNLELKL